MSGAITGGAVRVRAPGRLHLGFLDLGGSLGRRFGSLGLTLDQPWTQVLATPAATDSVSGPDADRAARVRDTVREALGFAAPVEIRIEHALPAHSGLGSGTQLALAVATAVLRCAGNELAPRAVEMLLGRGLRSAIGLAAFEQGGVILDGGKATGATGAAEIGDAPPPVIARHPVPESWRILLVFDTSRAGLSGEAETRAMGNLPPFPAALAAHLCHLTLMRALPALVAGDADAFGAAVGEIQRRLGDHYAAAQGGGRFTSPDVAEVLDFIERQGISGVGQSSWGPTGFALIGSQERAEELLQALHNRYGARANLEFDCVRGNNRGADVHML